MRAIVGAIGLTRSGLLLFAGDKRFSPPASYRRPRRHARFGLNSKRLRLFENATGGKWGTLFFGGRKYGDYNLSSHGNQRIQADAWGVSRCRMVCNHSKPILSEWAANPGCRSDLQHRGGKRSRLQHSRAGWPESVAPLRHPVHRLALLISLERYATSLPFFSLWPQRGADGAAPSKGYSRLELASCRLSRPSGGRNS
jgi:hypothetical protein